MTGSSHAFEIWTYNLNKKNKVNKNWRNLLPIDSCKIKQFEIEHTLSWYLPIQGELKRIIMPTVLLF